MFCYGVKYKLGSNFSLLNKILSEYYLNEKNIWCNCVSIFKCIANELKVLLLDMHCFALKSNSMRFDLSALTYSLCVVTT